MKTFLFYCKNVREVWPDIKTKAERREAMYIALELHFNHKKYRYGDDWGE